MAITIPLSLLVVHTIADFFLQSDWMALNKSKQWNALFLHCAVYALCFTWLGPLFVLVTFATHTITDAITSRINAKLWVANQRHWFFCAIGVDQLIHFVTLALTYKGLFNG